MCRGNNGQGIPNRPSSGDPLFLYAILPVSRYVLGLRLDCYADMQHLCLSLGEAMTTLYNQDDLRMEVDEDSVTLYLYDIKRIEMTRYEFEKLMEAYDENG